METEVNVITYSSLIFILPVFQVSRLWTSSRKWTVSVEQAAVVMGLRAPASCWFLADGCPQLLEAVHST